MTEQVTDKYAFLRENLQVLVAEAASKGGYNPRAKMIIDLLADYDALHAEAEALRAENERLNREADESLEALVSQRDAARTELEAARGLLLDMLDCPWVVEEATIPKAGIDAAPNQVVGTMHVGLSRLRKIRAFLTATPAPQVRQCAHEWVDARNSRAKSGELCIKCNAIRPGNQLEQGERQEAFVWMRPDGDGFFELTSEGDYLSFPLYKAPQPGPDVRGLVEALEEIVKQYPNPNITHVDYRVHACRQAEHGLNEYRQAQRQA